jgi:predicted Zn finger-like uncharacterized protein
MPVVIACPKCQTKYQLSDEMLGRAIKCKSCGTVFKTKRPASSSATSPAAGQKPGTRPAAGSTKPASGAARPTRPAGQPRPSAPAVSGADLAKFGLDGPLRRQADLFAGAANSPARGPDMLGNLAADPGFGGSEEPAADGSVAGKPKKQPAPSADLNDLSEILRNPYMAPANPVSAKKNWGKGGRSGNGRGSREGYGVARVGMWMIFVGMTYIFVVGGLAAFLQLIVTIAPGAISFIGQGVAQVIGIFVMLVTIGYLFSALSVLVGQFLCVFSPEKNEKTYAILSIGSLAVLVILFIVWFGVVAMAGVAGGRGNQAITAGVGIGTLGLLLLAFVLSLTYVFFFIHYFKTVGQNLQAPPLTEASKLAFYCWIGSIVAAVIAFVVVFVLAHFLDSYRSEKDFEAAQNLAKLIMIVGLVNTLINVGVLGSLAMMAMAGVKETKS